MKLKSIAANQTELTINDGTLVFFSYNTPVAAFVIGKGILRTSEKHSATTTRHINAFIKGYSPHVTITEVPQSELDGMIG